jgi:hypothetical protein
MRTTPFAYRLTSASSKSWRFDPGREVGLAVPEQDRQARRDGCKTGDTDPFAVFHHDVPRALAEQALSKERRQSPTAGRRLWPLDAWPAVPTRLVLCTEDRMLPPALMRGVAADRLGITPDEIVAGHCVALSRPVPFVFTEVFTFTGDRISRLDTLHINLA